MTQTGNNWEIHSVKNEHIQQTIKLWRETWTAIRTEINILLEQNQQYMTSHNRSAKIEKTIGPYHYGKGGISTN